MTSRLLLILLSLSLGSCSGEALKDVTQSPEQAAPKAFRAREVQDFREATQAQWDELLVDRFSLSREGCYGPCAIYKVEFFKGGRAVYTGKENAPREGVFQGEVRLYEYALLCSLSERIKLNQMDDQYLATWTDDETITIEIDSDGTSKSIEDYGRQAPPEFQAFRALFDELAAGIDWERVPQER